MTDEQTIATVQRQIRQTGRSLLQYANESFPYTRDARDHEVLSRLRELGRLEQQRMGEMAAFLADNHTGPPYLGAYPMYFTTMNYLALDRLVPLIAEHQRKDIADLESDLGRVQDPGARMVLADLLGTKKANLDALDKLRETATAPANTSANGE